MSETKSPKVPNDIPRDVAEQHLAKLLKACDRLRCGQHEVLGLLESDSQIHRLLAMSIELYLTRQARAKRRPMSEST